MLSKIPNIVSVAGVMLFGIWWLTGRKEVMDQVESGEITLEQAMQKMPALRPPEQHDEH